MRGAWWLLPWVGACAAPPVEVFYWEYSEGDACMVYEEGSALRPYRLWRDEFSRRNSSEIDVSQSGQTLDGACIILFPTLVWRGQEYGIHSYVDDEEWLVNEHNYPDEWLPACLRPYSLPACP